MQIVLIGPWPARCSAYSFETPREIVFPSIPTHIIGARISFPSPRRPLGSGAGVGVEGEKVGEGLGLGLGQSVLVQAAGGKA